MKRAIMFAAVWMAGLTLIGGTVQTQAATAKTGVIKKVITAEGSTLKDCLAQLEEQQWGNCTIITFPCIPGNGQIPEEKPEVPETPDNNQPEVPDNGQPESKPEVPDNSHPESKPEKPDNSQQEVPDHEAPGQENTTETEYHAYVLRVVELVNEEREKAGLKPLTLQKKISVAAQVRAQETEVSFSHTRPDGRNFATALTEAGVTYKGAGENIAWGQRTPEQVMNGWMNSAGHRANILNPKYTSIGVGYYQNEKGTNYWTQLFTY